MLCIWNCKSIFFETHEDKTNENGYVLRPYVQFMQLIKRFDLTTYLKYTLIFSGKY